MTSTRSLQLMHWYSYSGMRSSTVQMTRRFRDPSSVIRHPSSAIRLFTDDGSRMTDDALSARQRRDFFVRRRLGGQKHAIAKIDAGDAAFARPVVPRLVDHVAALVFRRPPWD